MTGNRSILSNFRHFNGGYVAFGSDSKGGSITGQWTVSNERMSIDKVNYVKELDFNLMSVSQVCDQKHWMLFTDKEGFVLSHGLSKPPPENILLTAQRKENLYVLDINEVNPSGSVFCFLSKASVDESALWHRRLSHGKQHKSSHKPKTLNINDTPLQLLHMDLFGPTNIMSMGKKSYYLVITDDYTRFSWVYFLRTKDETAEILKSYILRVENQSNQKSKGIERQYSAPRTPQQNGVAERRNRTLIESARSMLADSKLPLTFWAEAVSTACYVQNRVLIVKPLNKTPYELWFQRVPYIGFLKPFGCLCTILITHGVLPKFGAKSDKGYFVGYFSQSKAYRVFNSRTRIVEESANVECREHIVCEQGKGPNWIFDIDSFTQIFEPLIFSNMESSSSQAPDSTSSDYRLDFPKSSISLRRPSIDPPSVMEAIEASAARTTLSNVTSSSLSENENVKEDSSVNAEDAANTIADNTDVAVDLEDSSTMNEEIPNQNQSNLEQGI
ncbi:hypothetical protein L1987_57774 [Smallanthus sonchifolius]|uniref:Uncharacterized protein n=1 Tax=Smallanthus sonchifolius TaxID=185202 RepID=A0ACB9DE24_9ASTR|nr:hypothetical protein L1987_57774 [Smallanthus sonchifolius]